MTKQVVIASNNAHKVEEIKTALCFDGWEFKTMSEAGVVSSPEETGTTFEENARIKARAVYDITHTAPGVYSSRYSGVDGDDEANNAKLLEELKSISQEERSARFVCVLVFIDEDGSETVAKGCVEGRIGYEEEGSNGFGYDPLFLPEYFGYSQTLAEVSQDAKNKISHRGNALRELKKYLSNH